MHYTRLKKITFHDPVSFLSALSYSSLGGGSEVVSVVHQAVVSKVDQAADLEVAEDGRGRLLCSGGRGGGGGGGEIIPIRWCHVISCRS